MRKYNGYMIPKVKRTAQNKYVCVMCGKDLDAKSAYFYVDSCNCAITENSKPYCLDCYRRKYGE